MRNEILPERLEQVINLIPLYSWSLMTEEQRDELMAGVVLPRYMKTTSDGTKLTPSTWGAILGASADSIRKRVERLKASRKPANGLRTSDVSDVVRKDDLARAKRVASDAETRAAFIESLPLETRVEVAKDLAASTKSAPVSAKREKDSKAANAPLNRAVNSFAAQVGTVALIDRATGEINDAVAGDGLEDSALEQIEAAVERLLAAVEFAKAMRGGVT